MSDSKATAIGVIRSEHRTLAAVINNMKAVLSEVKAGRLAMDFPLFWRMIHYIDAFPNQQHHPKEDQWLFASVKRRTHLADGLIEELQRQHVAEPLALNEMRRSLGNLEADVSGSLIEFEKTVVSYADQTWLHLRKEEQDLLPIAEAQLLPEDWALMAEEFGRNRDPLAGAGPDAELGALFRDIVARTPAPLGLGSARG